MAETFVRSVRVKIYYDGDILLDKLFEAGPVEFGREPDNDVVLKFNFISKKHFELTEIAGEMIVRDLGSRNGIKNEGKRIRQMSFDNHNEITIEKMRVVFDLESTVAKALNQNLSPEKTEIWSPPGQIKSGSLQQTKDLGGTRAQDPTRIPDEPSPEAVTQIWNQMESTVIRRPDVGEAVLSGNFANELVTIHPHVLGTTNRKMEAVLMWNGQVYNVYEFSPAQKVLIGASSLADIQVPHLARGWRLARVDFQTTNCFVPKGFSAQVSDSTQTQEITAGQPFKLHPSQIAKIDLGSNLQLFLRYIPAAARLTERKVLEPDEAVKKALIGSAILHVILALVIFAARPTQKPAPQIKNVPERYARLLLETPKPPEPAPTPTTTPAPQPIPTIPPVVEKPPPPKPRPKQRPEPVHKKVEVKQKAPPKIVQTQPKSPVVEKRVVERPRPIIETNKNAGGQKGPPQVVKAAPVPVAPPPTQPPVKVDSLGALGALNSLPTSTKTISGPSKIQIQKAGTASGVAGGVAADTKAVDIGIPGGKGQLVATGSGIVKTHGQGTGSGSEYGTQGLKGKAGRRGVGASVVGVPQLKTSGSGRPEGLEREQVMSVVQQHIAEIQRCYERSLLASPGLAGRMEFEWDIEPSGNVSQARVKKSSVQGGDNLGECIRQVFLAMKFPKAKNGQSTQPNIGFPFGRL